LRVASTVIGVICLRNYWHRFRSWLDDHGWKQRARTDTLVIVALAFAAYAVAKYYEAFDKLHEVAHAYAAYGVDDALMVLLIVGVAMFIYCLRRMNELAQEMKARRQAEADRQIDNNRSQLAVDNMMQGLCMFDADNHLLVWNKRYQLMYNIDPARIWRGYTIRDLLEARIAAGTFPLDSQKYEAALRHHLAKGQTTMQRLSGAGVRPDEKSRSYDERASGGRRLRDGLLQLPAGASLCC
jgi:PAS domain-containing protein